MTTTSNSNGTPTSEASTGESSPTVEGSTKKLPKESMMEKAKQTPASSSTDNSSIVASKQTPYTLDDKERRVWELFLDANQRVRRHLISMTILEEDSDENNDYSVDDILNNTDSSMFADTDPENSAGGDGTDDRQGWSDPNVSVAEIMREFGQPGLTRQKEATLVERYAEPLTCHKMSEFVDYPEHLLAHVFEVVLDYTYTNIAASKLIAAN